MIFFFLNGEKVAGVELANYIIRKANEEEISISNLKLQKILYYVQGYFLAKFDRPLFPEEIHASKFGPTVPDVYYEFSRWGSDALVPIEEPNMNMCSNEEIVLIDAVIDFYLPMSQQELIKRTLREDPWRIATNNGNIIRQFLHIPNSSMMDYFRKFPLLEIEV